MSPLLLLHGFTGTPRSFDLVLERLQFAGRVLAPWLVGHGVPAAAPEVTRFEDEVDRLASLLAKDEPALVVGYSLGARLALGLTARHPQRVRACVMVSGRDGLSEPSARAERRALDARWIALLQEQGLAAFVARWEQQPLFSPLFALPDQVLQRQQRERLGHTALGLCHSLRTTGLAEMPHYGEQLAEVTVPLELLAGERDTAFCQHAEAVVGKLRRGTLTRIPQGSHNLLLERPDVVASAIERGIRS